MQHTKSDFKRLLMQNVVRIPAPLPLPSVHDDQRTFSAQSNPIAPVQTSTPQITQHIEQNYKTTATSSDIVPSEQFNNNLSSISSNNDKIRTAIKAHTTERSSTVNPLTSSHEEPESSPTAQDEPCSTPVTSKETEKKKKRSESSPTIQDKTYSTPVTSKKAKKKKTQTDNTPLLVTSRVGRMIKRRNLSS